MRRRDILKAGIGASNLLFLPKMALANVWQQNGTYSAFLDDVTQQAQLQGIPHYVADVAFADLTAPNQKILAANAHQSEFTLSWEQYKQRTVTQNKITSGFNIASNYANTLRNIENIYHVESSVIIAIWGLESSYGNFTGNHPVIDTLATLAYAGRRHDYFLTELLNALHIIYGMTVMPSDMTGSYAGAMGQPQFMPKTYLQFAATYPQRNDYSDIWHNEGDVIASIANFLHSSGWGYNEGWGERVKLPSVGFSVKQAQVLNPASEIYHSTSWWQQQGVAPVSGGSFLHETGTLLQPDGIGGEAFMIYDNFDVIKRYNASDSYALTVCLLSDAIKRAVKDAI